MKTLSVRKKYLVTLLTPTWQHFLIIPELKHGSSRADKAQIVNGPFSPPCWQSCFPTASMLSVISAGHVCCQLRRLVTMESNRDRHLELGHQGYMAKRVRISGAMALNADLKRNCVFGPCDGV